MQKINLDFEVSRLNTKLRKFPKEYIAIMSYADKIDFIADAVILGWYGNNDVRKAILKDKYDDVRLAVNRKIRKPRI